MATEAQIKAWLGGYNRDFNQLCQALMWQLCNKFGSAPVVYASAVAARNASVIVSTDALAAPPGAFHYWDIGTFGHVAAELGGGRVLMGSTHIQERWGINAGVTTVASYTGATGARYRGWANTNGANDFVMEAAALAGNQRVVGAITALRRVTPDRSQPDIEPSLAPGTVGTFDGWIRGENVNGNDVWFHGAYSPNWFWSGGFTDTGIHDLADMNPVVVPPATGVRTVLPTAASRFRNASNTGAAILGEYPAGSDQTFAYWQAGESVNGNNVWYVTPDGKNFSWSGGYTSTSKDGLTELVATTPPPVSVWPSTPYSFAKAGDFVTRVAPAHWSNFENIYSVPNKPDGTSDRKGFPALPTSVVDHQWGAPGAYLITSVINTFQAVHNNADDRVSAHFVVNADEIVQMVSLTDRAYHAGPGGNDFVGIEIDPYISEMVNGVLTDRATKIIANVRKVLTFLGQRNANVALTNVLHKNVLGASTSCGTFIEPVLPLLNVQPVLTPGEPPVDPPVEVPDYTKALAELQTQLVVLQATVDNLSEHLGAV